LALMALEDCALEGRAVVDIGTGSGILAIAALHLGASRVIGADIDVSALATARENLGLNGATAELVCGSANALADSVADVTVANMNGTVLLAIFDDLVRITRRHGQLILTGFPVSESEAFMQQLSQGQLFELQKWSCLAARVS
jgi:ribosomal protein L11 methyltransferase